MGGGSSVGKEKETQSKSVNQAGCGRQLLSSGSWLPFD